MAFESSPTPGPPFRTHASGPRRVKHTHIRNCFPGFPRLPALMLQGPGGLNSKPRPGSTRPGLNPLAARGRVPCGPRACQSPGLPPRGERPVALSSIKLRLKKRSPADDCGLKRRSIQPPLPSWQTEMLLLPGRLGKAPKAFRVRVNPTCAEVAAVVNTVKYCEIREILSPQYFSDFTIATLCRCSARARAGPAVRVTSHGEPGCQCHRLRVTPSESAASDSPSRALSRDSVKVTYRACRTRPSALGGGTAGPRPALVPGRRRPTVPDPGPPSSDSLNITGPRRRPCPRVR